MDTILAGRYCSGSGCRDESVQLESNSNANAIDEKQKALDLLVPIIGSKVVSKTEHNPSQGSAPGSSKALLNILATEDVADLAVKTQGARFCKPLQITDVEIRPCVAFERKENLREKDRIEQWEIMLAH